MLKLFDRLKLTPSERRLVVGILVVAFLVVNYWVVWPRFGDYKTIRDDIASMRRKKGIYETEIERKPTYEVMLRKLKSEGSVLPEGEERIAFRRDMERLARDVGLNVPRWGEVLPERGGQSTNAFFEAIGITLNGAAGTEQQFVEFLHKVGASNSTIRVKELTLTPGGFDSRSQGKTNLVGNLRLVASVQKPPPKASNAPPSSASAPLVPVSAGTATAQPPNPKPSSATPAAPSPGTGPKIDFAAGSIPRTNASPVASRPLGRANSNTNRTPGAPTQ